MSVVAAWLHAEGAEELHEPVVLREIGSSDGFASGFGAYNEPVLRGYVGGAQPLLRCRLLKEGEVS